MPANARNMLCRYHYDPLDRLVGTTPTEDERLLRFYCKSRLATEIQGAVQRSVFQQGEQLLAQQERQGDLAETSLLATDQMRSVLQLIKATCSGLIAYSPYGHRPRGSGLLSLLGFNGELSDPVTGDYLLGNGCRAFNPVLMRFTSPDYLSPFGKGGLNSYAYCLGDPINREDSSGHVSWMRGVDATLSMINKGANNLFNSAKKIKTSKGTGMNNVGNAIGEKQTPVILKNLTPSSMRSEYQEFNSFQEEMNKSLVKTVASRDDLKRLVHNYHYKFIFTDQQQLVVGGSPGTKGYDYLSHPVLSQYSSSPKVVSAGYIARQGNNMYEIENSSGHYKTNFETLPTVVQYLRGLGVEVKLFRAY